MPKRKRSDMAHEYFWKNNEANFGPPIKTEVNGGTHITLEIILKKGKHYIGLRRPDGIEGHVMTPKEKASKNGMLYFCHDLIRYGESVDRCVKRIVKTQSGVNVKRFETVFLEAFIKDKKWSLKNKQWALIPHIIAEVDNLPKTGNYRNKITEVVVFNKNTMPEDFAWWPKKDLKEFLEKYD